MNARIHLVRHGHAARGWDRDADPQLDAVGQRQALQVAQRLGPIGPVAIVTSPLRRCRETAAPLAEAWDVEPSVELAVAEIPSPPDVAMEDRVDWLRQAAAGTWDVLGDRYTEFRGGVLRFVAGCARETVIFSHFIAINVVLGACLDDDRLVIRRLDNTSVTVVENDAGRLRLVEPGHEAETIIR